MPKRIKTYWLSSPELMEQSLVSESEAIIGDAIAMLIRDSGFKEVSFIITTKKMTRKAIDNLEPWEG